MSGPFILQEAAADSAPRVVRICTDSQSALQREGPAAHRDVLVDWVWQRLRKLADWGTHISLQWVPGHAGLPGSKMADKVVCNCAAADLSQDGAPMDLQSAMTRLQRHAHGDERSTFN